jgi:hypothetical protein
VVRPPDISTVLIIAYHNTHQQAMGTQIYATTAL